MSKKVQWCNREDLLENNNVKLLRFWMQIPCFYLAAKYMSDITGNEVTPKAISCQMDRNIQSATGKKWNVDHLGKAYENRKKDLAYLGFEVYEGEVESIVGDAISRVRNSFKDTVPAMLRSSGELKINRHSMCGIRDLLIDNGYDRSGYTFSKGNYIIAHPSDKYIDIYGQEAVRVIHANRNLDPEAAHEMGFQFNLGRWEVAGFGIDVDEAIKLVDELIAKGY